MSRLSFFRVQHKDQQAINAVYNILLQCGKDMYLKQGLLHWKNPYPKEYIERDCIEKYVFLVKQGSESVATFQLKKDEKGAHLSKFAVLPVYAKNGIGGQSLCFMEGWCKNEKIELIHLDVYDKSDNAIRFYTHKGFSVVGTSQTKHFRVLLMEKRI